MVKNTQPTTEHDGLSFKDQIRDSRPADSDHFVVGGNAVPIVQAVQIFDPETQSRLQNPSSDTDVERLRREEAEESQERQRRIEQELTELRRAQEKTQSTTTTTTNLAAGERPRRKNRVCILISIIITIVVAVAAVAGVSALCNWTTYCPSPAPRGADFPSAGGCQHRRRPSHKEDYRFRLPRSLYQLHHSPYLLCLRSLPSLLCHQHCLLRRTQIAVLGLL